jgi:hypothetical protein
MTTRLIYSPPGADELRPGLKLLLVAVASAAIGFLAGVLSAFWA